MEGIVITKVADLLYLSIEKRITRILTQGPHGSKLGKEFGTDRDYEKTSERQRGSRNRSVQGIPVVLATIMRIGRGVSLVRGWSNGINRKQSSSTFPFT